MKVQCVVLALSVASASVVDPQLTQTMKHKTSIDIIVQVKEMPTISSGPRKQFSSRTEKIESLAASLQEDAAESQVGIMQVLQQESMGTSFASAESFWISNSVFIADASPALISELSLLPEVSEIHEEQTFDYTPIEATVDYHVASNFTFDTVSNGLEWGLAQIDVPEAWKSNKGKGIIVGSIDSGVRGTHEALKHNYVGAKKHGWYDPYGKSKVPSDPVGHGTHTMGSIVGHNGIGVAPDAQWMACTSIAGKKPCSEKALLACGQFMLCPTDTDGKNPDCSLAPHVVSNSWGGSGRGQFFDKVIAAWKTAGIVAVFSGGNVGPRCRSIDSPSDHPHVISVGATTLEDKLARFSSNGPGKRGNLIKPDISAPGENIRSAWFKGDDAYFTMSGTSMATPHVAGVVALLKAQDKSLSYNQIYQALIQTASTDGLQGLGKHCGRVRENKFPNNAFGHGKLNAARALAFIRSGQHKNIQEPVVVPRTPRPRKGLFG